jgi:hypothetical protein
MARRKLTEAEKDEKNRRHYEAYTKIMADIDRQVEERERRLRPSAIIIRFPLERTCRPARREGYNHGRA